MPESVENTSDPIAVLISRAAAATFRGADPDAEREGRLGGRIALVISNRPEAGGLDHARAAGIETCVLPHQGFATREDYDDALIAVCNAR